MYHAGMVNQKIKNLLNQQVRNSMTQLTLVLIIFKYVPAAAAVPFNGTDVKYMTASKDVFKTCMKMFLKPVWVGKIYGVGVYATHSVRIWWFRNKFSLFQL